MYKSIEEITLNTWPAEQSVLLNGWILRTAAGYTKRANSINPLYGTITSPTEITEQIKLAEQYYEHAEIQSVFKISPFVQPVNLDGVLAERGYTIADPSSLRILELNELVPVNSQYSVLVSEHLTEEWLNTFAEFAALSIQNRNTLTRMLSASNLQQGYALLFKDNVPTACGLGVIQNGYIGLYDIITASDQRRQGMAEQLLLTLLQWGKSKGATTAFLQVVQANAGAIALYDRLGFREIYQYWYRVKN